MSISATLPDKMDLAVVDSGSSTSSTMSVMQREFARHFVLTGGDATRAAALAGYSDTNPSKAGWRNLLNGKILAEIKRLCIVNTESYLPQAVRTVVELMLDPETPAKVRMECAFGLMDRAGMAAPKGGTTVNVGVQVNGGEVQALIGSVWDAKQSRMSGIGASMSDTQPAIEQAEQPALVAPTEPMGWGGVASSGSPGFPSNIPPPPANPHQFPQAEGRDDASDPGYATLSDGTRADGRPSWGDIRPDELPLHPVRASEASGALGSIRGESVGDNGRCADGPDIGEPAGRAEADMAGCHRAVAVTAERATDAGPGDAWGRAAAASGVGGERAERDQPGAGAGGVFDGAVRAQRQPLDYD